MLSVEQLRKIDPETADMSDEEIEALRADMYETVQLAFEAWWQDNSGSKYPVGSLPLSDEAIRLEHGD